jgi:apolipoprotein N-acyltransferase
MANSKNALMSSAPFLLITGSVLILFTFMRFSISELGWVVYAPLLVFIYERSSLKHHLALLATITIAYLLTISKMVTSEIPWTPVPMFAIPMAFSTFVSLSIAGMAHRRLGVRWGLYTFASMITVLGWIQYSFTPGASWGILAHTQSENLPLVQLGSITGLGGITFLVALGSGLTAAVWTSNIAVMRKDIAGFGVVLFCVLLYGQFRLSETSPGEMIRIGGVVSPVTHKEFKGAYKNIDTLRSFDDELFARSAVSADLGAKVVVWNEIATIVTAEGENPLVSRGQAFAKEKGVLLLMAYGVAVSMHPFHMVNKYRIYLPDGTKADEYMKRHPVPGDPEDPGIAHARVIRFNGINFSGGICYDYSFPEIARDNVKDGAELALVPSSDWRGIDPEHGRMAMMNAVAVGLPMIRPVRAATSFAFDSFGRELASLQWSGSGDGVYVAAMRGKHVPTLYAQTGEVVPLVALSFLFTALLFMLRTSRNVP